MGDRGGGHWLVRIEWRPAGWSMFLPLLIFPCTIKSRNSLLAPAYPGGPGKRAVKWLCVWVGIISEVVQDRRIGTTENYGESLCSLSDSANDLE